MTSDEAKQIIEKFEGWQLRTVRRAGGTGDISLEDLHATDTGFVDFYLSSSSTSGNVITTQYRIRDVKFAELGPIKREQRPSWIFISLCTAFLGGPRQLRYFDSNEVISEIDGPKAYDFFPAWLIGYGYWGNNKHCKYFKALEYMRRQAQGPVPADTPQAPEQ